jgi:hypothetical protein
LLNEFSLKGIRTSPIATTSGTDKELKPPFYAKVTIILIGLFVLTWILFYTQAIIVPRIVASRVKINAFQVLYLCGRSSAQEGVKNDSVPPLQDTLRTTEDSLKFKAIEDLSKKTKFTRFIHSLLFKPLNEKVPKQAGIIFSRRMHIKPPVMAFWILIFPSQKSLTTGSVYFAQSVNDTTFYQFYVMLLTRM